MPSAMCLQATSTLIAILTDTSSLYTYQNLNMTTVLSPKQLSKSHPPHPHVL
jgi:hypothetical protein